MKQFTITLKSAEHFMYLFCTLPPLQLMFCIPRTISVMLIANNYVKNDTKLRRATE